MSASSRLSVTTPSADTREVLRTLLYFDVFEFPLTEAEILRYLSTSDLSRSTLDSLVAEGWVQEEAGYFGFGNLSEKVENRRNGAREAARFMAKARTIASWLSRIPFVRCVCVSGSLSKGYMDESSDIDFFLVVRENRLWIVRAIFSALILGLGAFNIRKYFCPNYIMVDSNLAVGDRTRFTATEISSLIPLYNQALYDRFLEQNQWVKDFLPNLVSQEAFIPSERKHRFDFFWKSAVCGLLDDGFFKLYQWHYGRKFRNLAHWKLTPADVNFRKNVYKMHNTGHRGRILEQFENRIRSYSAAFGIDLS